MQKLKSRKRLIFHGASGYLTDLCGLVLSRPITTINVARVHPRPLKPLTIPTRSPRNQIGSANQTFALLISRKHVSVSRIIRERYRFPAASHPSARPSRQATGARWRILTLGWSPRVPPTVIAPEKSVKVTIGLNRFRVPFCVSSRKCHDITIRHYAIIIIIIL